MIRATVSVVLMLASVLLAVPGVLAVRAAGRLAAASRHLGGPWE